MNRYKQLEYARSCRHIGPVVIYPEGKEILLKMFPNEKWKVIPGFDGKYLISNKGNVYSTSKCKIIKRRINRFGYYDIGLDANGCNKTIKIHRAVAEAFVQNPFNFKVVNHIDGNKSNNDFSNLEWCTYSHNSRHAVDHGLIKSSKRVICKDTGEVFPSVARCANELGYSRTHLTRCIENGKSYKGLTFAYYEDWLRQIGGQEE